MHINMSQAIERKVEPTAGGKRKRKGRKKVVLREGDKEAPLPPIFRTDSLGSRDDEDSREALVVSNFRSHFLPFLVT